MLDSQRIQIDIIKLTKEINAMPLELRADDPEAETRMAERIAKGNQLTAMYEKQIAAMEKEDQEAQAAMSRHVNTDGWTPELRAFHDLGQRVTIADYIQAAVTQQEVRGAAKEYNDHVFGTSLPGSYPLEMLLDRDEYYDMDARTWGSLIEGDEKRAVITGVAATHGNPTFVERLLATSDAAYCMARFPAVGPGRHSYPIVSGTTVSAVIARDTAEVPAGGLTIVDADPERVQHSYEYAVADELQIPGIANGLASDLRMSLMSGLDNKVIDDLIANVTGGDESADPITLANLFTLWGSVVNGVAAKNVNEVKWLVGAIGAGAAQPSTYATVLGGSIANVTAAFLAIPHDRFRGSSHIAPTGGGDQNAISIRTGTNAPRLLVPTWRGGTLLRDPNSQQLKGHIVLTGVMYIDVILVNSDQHSKHEIHPI